MENYSFVLFLLGVIGFVAFRQWLQHQRRVLIHRERLAAIEKGVALPAVEQEVKRSNLNVKRLLLLAGMIWIVLGVAAFVTLGLVTMMNDLPRVPHGIQYVGIAPVGIGIAHLITYWVESRRQP